MAEEKVYIKHDEVGTAPDPVPVSAFEGVWEPRGWKIDLRPTEDTESGVRSSGKSRAESAEEVREEGDASDARGEDEKVAAKNADQEDPIAEPRIEQPVVADEKPKGQGKRR